MFKRLFIFGILICLANCTAPGSAFFGPTFTGVKTGSVYQTSLSYGSSKAVDTIKVKVIENIEKFNELELSQSSNKRLAALGRSCTRRCVRRRLSVIEHDMMTPQCDR